MDINDLGNILIGILIGMLGFILVYGLLTEFQNPLSKQTMNDICFNLNQTKGITGHAENGKLICEVPSFDSTQSIIIRPNNGGED